MANNKELKLQKTEIDGLFIINLPVHNDNRGWFKENWQKEKFNSLKDFPNFVPVQNNISYNDSKGVTRGVHAEPWDKLISVANGSIFGAWIDLRKNSKTYKKVVTKIIDVSKCVFVPSGVGNSYQTLEEKTSYSYLVNAHWNKNTKYTLFNLKDLRVKWPTPLNDAIISEKDLNLMPLNKVTAFLPKRTLVIGSNGQLGKALKCVYKNSKIHDFVDVDTFDITNKTQVDGFNWLDYDTVINASAYTNVDLAETEKGKKDAWNINVNGVLNLVNVCRKNNILFIHISSDYVFGNKKHITPISENEITEPLGVYGETKAAADAIVSTLDKYYILRTSWLIGNLPAKQKNNNFVKTILKLGKKGVSPEVVDDQIGRLTFTSTLANAIKFLVDKKKEFGIYNVSNSGTEKSWFEIAKIIYKISGYKENLVIPISTNEYIKKNNTVSKRPFYSVFLLDKIKKAGFKITDFEVELKKYIKELKK